MQKYYCDETGKQKKNKGLLEQYHVRDNHPAIINREDWEEAQRIRNGRAAMYPFSRLLKCPHCGASLVHYKNRRWVYWLCNTYMEHTKSACPGINVPERILLEIHKETPIIEPMVVEEVINEGRKRKTKENFRLIPVAEYSRYQ